MTREELKAVVANRILNQLRDIEDKRIDRVAKKLAEFLVESDMISEATLFELPGDAK